VPRGHAGGLHQGSCLQMICAESFSHPFLPRFLMEIITLLQSAAYISKLEN
jgi:hypothetical protein